MTAWKWAFLIAGVLEAPLVVLMAVKGFDYSLSLVWYHVVPLSLLAVVVFGLFGHGNPPGGEYVFTAIFFSLTFLIQAALTAPIIFLASRLFGRLRARGPR